MRAVDPRKKDGRDVQDAPRVTARRAMDVCVRSSEYRLRHTGPADRRDRLPRLRADGDALPSATPVRPAPASEDNKPTEVSSTSSGCGGFFGRALSDYRLHFGRRHQGRVRRGGPLWFFGLRGRWTGGADALRWLTSDFEGKNE